MVFRIKMKKQKNNPLVSILIVNYNGREILSQCLESLNKTKYSKFEVIVIDNGSTDDSVSEVKRRYASVTLIQAKENLGFARGNNVSLKHAKGKYVVLLNGDTEVEPDWLEKLVDFAEEHPDGGVFGSKILFFDHKKIINSAGGLCDIYGFSPLRGTYEKDCKKFNKPEEVFYAHGAAMMVRKSLIEKIGFLDETYFIYHEELDFCWRALLFGAKVYYVPGSVVYHKLRQRNFYQKDKLAQRQFLVKKNRIRTIIKNHKSLYLVVLALFINVIVALGESVYLLSKGDFESPKGIIRAYLWNLRMLPDTLAKRKEVQSLYRVPQKKVLGQMRKRPFAFGIFVGIIKGKYTLPL